MARRLIITPEQIYARRAQEWAWHYEKRSFVKCLIENGWGVAVIIEVLERELPKPRLLLDASLAWLPIQERKAFERPYQVLCRLGWPVDYMDLLNIWYWGEAYWMLFVNEFQSLSDVVENQCM